MTPSRSAAFAAALALTGATGCTSDPVSVTPADLAPQFAKPAPLPPMQFLFPAFGFGLVGDGSPYVDGVCGVTAVMNPDVPGVEGFFDSLDPSCGRQAVRITLQVRHLGYDANGNDIDDADAPPIVSDVSNMAIRQGANGLSDAAKINFAACLHLGKNRRYTGVGLRFQSADYPGSDDLAVSVSGNNIWQIDSRPYPDNIAYCDGDATGGPSSWHVDVSMTVSPK